MNDETPRALTSLGSFLKARRREIDANASALGMHERLPVRRGRPVTQEEIAEAIGVSRVWYSMLESGAAVRTSAQLLGKLAAALMLDADARVTMFSLAIPELKRTRLSPASEDFLESCSIIRKATRSLWAATSEQEGLTVVARELSTWFRDATMINYTQRLDTGVWTFECLSGKTPVERWYDVGEDFFSHLNREEIDELLLYPALAQPGDVGTVDDYPSTLRPVVFNTWNRHGIAEQLVSFLSARVRSRQGLVGAITASHGEQREYSPPDRAMIATLAELTSLAFSSSGFGGVA